MNNTRFKLLRIMVIIILTFGNILWLNFVYQKLANAGAVGRSNLASQGAASITNLNEGRIKLVEDEYYSRKDYNVNDSPKDYVIKQELIVTSSSTSSASSSSSTQPSAPSGLDDGTNDNPERGLTGFPSSSVPDLQ